MLETDEKQIAFLIELPRYFHIAKERQSDKCEAGISIDCI